MICRTWLDFGRIVSVFLVSSEWCFFLIPVAKHGPILAAMGWHPYHACTIHIWLGYIAIYASIAHFIAYCVSWIAKGDTAQQHFWAERYCWKAPVPPVLEDDAMEPPPMYEPYISCKEQIQNFYGLVALTA